jgi:predicted methyltransferase
VAKSVEPCLADNRLPNVNRIIETPGAINTLEQGCHAAIFVLGMHDLYYGDLDQGWVAIDRTKFLKNIYKILKPGAVFGVIDENGEAGADNQVIGQKLHRADPAAMIKDLLAAGFEFEGQSDLLANAEDYKTTSVFLPVNR